MGLRERFKRLESRFGGAILGPKRPLPEWLQETMESQGYGVWSFRTIDLFAAMSDDKPRVVTWAR
jgi:hypothetical protein